MVAKNTAPKAPRAPRATKASKAAAAAQDTLLLEHAQFIEGDLALNDLLASLGDPDEVVETAEPDEVLDLAAETQADDAGDDALNDLIASLNAPEEVLVAAPVVDAAPAAAVVVVDDADMGLADLIASLSAPDEVVAPPAVFEMDDAMLDAAVSSAEATEATVLAATPEGVIDPGAVPTGNASDVVPAKSAAATGEDKPKRVAVPRKHYTDKTERLKDKLGDSLGEYSVLTLADAVDDSQIEAKMQETMTIIKGMSGKAQNWAVKTVEYLAGKKSSMSEVTLRIFKLLEKDGFITTGVTGNLYLNLISKPYSPGAARAMGGNNLAALSGLKIIQADGKGRWVANPDSLLGMKARSMLFSPAAAAPELPDLSAADFETDEADAAGLEAEATEAFEDALL